MAPDVSNLLRYLRVPELRYRDAHARPARRAHERPPRAGVTILALVSLVRGVGRTTLAANLATSLGRRGLRAAAIDLDPRADLRSHFRDRLDAAPRAPFTSDALFRPLTHARLDAPGAGLEIEWPERTVGFVSHGADHASAVEAAWDCDVAVLDTGAGASDTVEQALAEADEVIVVARPDRESLDAVRPTEALLARCRMRSWRRTRARYLVNQFDGRRAIDRQSLAALRAILGPRLLWPAVQEDVAVREALAAGRCIEDVAKGSQVVADLQVLAQELLPAAGRKEAR